MVILLPLGFSSYFLFKQRFVEKRLKLKICETKLRIERTETFQNYEYE